MQWAWVCMHKSCCCSHTEFDSQLFKWITKPKCSMALTPCPAMHVPQGKSGQETLAPPQLDLKEKPSLAPNGLNLDAWPLEKAGAGSHRNLGSSDSLQREETGFTWAPGMGRAKRSRYLPWGGTKQKQSLGEESSQRSVERRDRHWTCQPSQVLDGHEAPFSPHGKKIMPERVREIYECPEGEQGPGAEIN